MNDNFLTTTTSGLVPGLKRHGVAGVLSNGLFNTIYYLTTFLLVWFCFAPAPGRMGYAAAVERFFKVMAMVWAGSQVTKIMRAAGALALAPFVDRGLSWFTDKFKFESKGKAFAAIAGMCFGLAPFLCYGLRTLTLPQQILHSSCEDQDSDHVMTRISKGKDLDSSRN